MLEDVVNEIKNTVQDVFLDMCDEEVTQTLTYHSIDNAQTYNPETGEFEAVSPGIPTYTGLTVNPSSQGNDVFELGLSKTVVSSGGDPLLGWTVEISNDAVTYETMDLTTAIRSIAGAGVRVELSPFTRSTIQNSAQFRVSYSGGDLENPADGSPLADFSNDTTSTNNSTVDLAANIENWHKLEEAVDVTREPEIDYGNAYYDLEDANSVGTQTGVSGLAAQFTGENYLITTIGDAYDPPVSGVFTLAYYQYVNVAPSVHADGNAYPIHKWRPTSTRSWGALMSEGGLYPDQLWALGMNSSDQQFSQRAANRGAFPTTGFYLVIMVFDPLAATPVIIYTCKINDINDFVVDDDNYSSPAAGSPVAKQTGAAAAFVVGKLQESASANGFNGAIDTPIFWSDKALTEAEARDLAYAYAEPPFYPVP